MIASGHDWETGTQLIHAVRHHPGVADPGENLQVVEVVSEGDHLVGPHTEGPGDPHQARALVDDGLRRVHRR